MRMLRPVEHRLQLLPNGFIDDAYNSNPAGFRAALEVLSDFGGQRVLVTPGMVELGERQEALNRELGAYAVSRCDYAVLVGGETGPAAEGRLAVRRVPGGAPVCGQGSEGRSGAFEDPARAGSGAAAHRPVGKRFAG